MKFVLRHPKEYVLNGFMLILKHRVPARFKFKTTLMVLIISGHMYDSFFMQRDVLRRRWSHIKDVRAVDEKRLGAFLQRYLLHASTLET